MHYSTIIQVNCLSDNSRHTASQPSITVPQAIHTNPSQPCKHHQLDSVSSQGQVQCILVDEALH